MAVPESPDALALGKAIRSVREKTGASQESVALKAGFHRNYYSDVERGNRNITHATLLKIAKALDVKASELLARAGQ
ncbi:MAG: helix-turn-helix transcriptional regulator [Solirubrobacterales bacterium]|nr:helix-turn-helix transcriptional regulator [Solirubrobacterales bacterium]